MCLTANFKPVQCELLQLTEKVTGFSRTGEQCTQHDTIYCVNFFASYIHVVLKLLEKNSQKMSLFRVMFWNSVHWSCGQFESFWKLDLQHVHLQIWKTYCLHKQEKRLTINFSKQPSTLSAHLSWGFGFDLPFKASQNSAPVFLCVSSPGIAHVVGT